MGKERYYGLHFCRNCENEFLTAKEKMKKKSFCPYCGENMPTQRIKTVGFERPILYRREWTAEELELIDSAAALGRTDKMLAAEMPGRTVHAIRSRRMRLLKERGEAVL